MKLSITLIFLACASIILAQSTKIDEEERARLENQFKALKTFYINDDGLVVYQIQNKDEVVETEVVEQDKQKSIPTQSKNAESDLEVPIVNRSERKNVETNTKKQSAYTATPTQVEVVSISKSPVKPESITKPYIDVIPKKNVSEANVVTPLTPVVEDSKNGLVQSNKDNLKSSAKKVANIDVKASAKAKSKKSVFDKPPLKYKNMEEAAMAVDDLLEKLKKEQNSNTNSGSMSSRIARGAGKSTLRKQTTSDINYDEVDQTSHSSNQEDFDNDADLYLPSYFINGQQVDKIEVDKLRKKDIISREIRTRNVVSGNPAGEIWYEVRTLK